MPMRAGARPGLRRALDRSEVLEAIARLAEAVRGAWHGQEVASAGLSLRWSGRSPGRALPMQGLSAGQSRQEDARQILRGASLPRELADSRERQVARLDQLIEPREQVPPACVGEATEGVERILEAHLVLYPVGPAGGAVA